MKLSKQQLMDILGVKKAGLKSIENRQQLKERLKEKGYEFKDKIKEGRKIYYIAEQTERVINLHKTAKQINEFKVDADKWNNKGIYYILNNKDMYIGSTIMTYRKRFLKHYNGSDKEMKYTYDLLHNGGIFNILYDMSDIEDEPLIRMIEQEYINYFKNYTDYNVINKNNETYSKFSEKIKYKCISIDKRYLLDIINFLEINNINYKEVKRR